MLLGGVELIRKLCLSLSLSPLSLRVSLSLSLLCRLVAWSQAENFEPFFSSSPY